MHRSVLFTFSLLLFTSAFTSSFAATDGELLMQLLNSRSAQSPKAYAKAAEEVRKRADKGGILQKYAIATLSLFPDAPEAAKLSAREREAWFEETRDTVRELAERKDSSLAWYLISLEKNNMPALERAAEGGSVQAQNAWGTILVSQAQMMTNASSAAYTFEKGFACFRSAAIKKDVNGMYNLGTCYLHGFGCRRDEAKAFEWFSRAAEGGHPEAINNVGGFYRDGIVVATNAAASVMWFKKSAELGNPYGELNYALALQRGDGVKRDDKAAAKWLALAVEQDCPEAMTVYGTCYYHGRGVKKDEEEAFRLYRRAAEAGFPPAMANLATCYENGTGTPKDVLKAATWKMRHRAALGDETALDWLRKNDK